MLLMSDLKKLQESFMSYLLAEASTKDIEGVDAGVEFFKPAEFIDRIAQQDGDKEKGIDANLRIQIYANAYRIRLKETIETDHEMLGLYLGDELFDRMVAGYVSHYPSSYRSLRTLCDNLPRFLEEDEFFCQYPIISQLAAFERRLLNAFDAADSERAEFAQLQVLQPEHWPSVTFRFHSSVQLYHCESNCVESWQALKAGEAPPAPDYEGKRVWLLWRGAERLTEFTSLSLDQYVLLDGFLKGNNFSEQCELMLEYFDADQVSGKVFEALHAWFQMGIIRQIIV